MKSLDIRWLVFRQLTSADRLGLGEATKVSGTAAWRGRLYPKGAASLDPVCSTRRCPTRSHSARRTPCVGPAQQRGSCRTRPTRRRQQARRPHRARPAAGRRCRGVPSQQERTDPRQDRTRGRLTLPMEEQTPEPGAAASPAEFDPDAFLVVPPRTFEDLRIGEVFRAPSRTLTDAHAAAFQTVSADNHPEGRQRHRGHCGHRPQPARPTRGVASWA